MLDAIASLACAFGAGVGGEVARRREVWCVRARWWCVLWLLWFGRCCTLEHKTGRGQQVDDAQSQR